jgi:hypothetical protein
MTGTTFNLRVEVQCNRCGAVQMMLFHNMRKRKNTKACNFCNKREPVVVPYWLYRRCNAQQQRCENSSAEHYDRYGGRGIKFNFKGPNEASRWIAENLGIPDDTTMEIDRRDNNGHYEPGNLRWANRVANLNNTSVSGARERFIAFREKYPEVKYADSTLNRLVREMTDEEIVKRWASPSFKPKGKYGTFSTQGLYRGLPRTED